MRVYVKNQRNQPLMPTTQRKARIFLKQKKAKIITYEPFTIQLLYATGETTQETILGVDAGNRTIGLSATTYKCELFSAELKLRTDIVELLATKRQFRRSRRSRKTRYRQPRFENRKKTEGWLAPSIENKIGTHLKVVNKVHSLLPISKIIIEVASFDIQKIKNPDIQGEKYQQGNQLGFWNVREYVIFRDGHKCQGKKNCKGKILNVHHIESRKTGGDSPDNLITLCEDCHKDYHSGKLKLNLKRGQSFRDAAFMGIMRWSFYNKLKELYSNVNLTYGYITKNTRITNNLPKEHRIDALCITGNSTVKRLDNWYLIKQVRKKKRSLHEAIARKGRKEPNITSKRNSKNTKEIISKGKKWCLFDKVKIGSNTGFVSGFTGNMVYVQDIEGNYLQVSPKYKQISTDNVSLISRNNNWIYKEVALGTANHPHL
ncbi:RNA-guided endonuclease IscB [Clostridium magnum]|uniref:HNH endonuclease n=1 Tax=Clostridium magnum DSM 2767 TaxID=1121326 RepID=A0A162TLM1_9CLOT|nr:RNA-guided endonuclease IscB [Clostridium magnum]KZL92800.1 HNH endonuclease [Clostridium magnum DSM 2767]SHI28644.1 HNH endonuclease [Clostridium magnum DSM 2767]